MAEIQRVRPLMLRLKKAGASPLTPLHIYGEENAMTDLPLRSFGSNIYWFCKNDTDLLNLFNKNPPFPNQASRTVFGPSNKLIMKIISVLRMQNFEIGEWLQLKKVRKTCWKNWCSFFRPLRVEPWLQDATY